MTAISPYLDPALLRAAGSSLLVDGDRDFLAKLTLGQIIEGRVLRVYEPNRGLMRFAGGEEHVVDSAIPLRQDEVVRGRVIGIGERVEIRRITADASSSARDEAGADGEPPALPDLPGRAGRVIAELFQRFRGALDADGAKALLTAAARQPDPMPAALSGLVLAKAGLPMTPELLRVLQDALSRRGGGAFAKSREAVRLGAADSSDTRSPEQSLREIGTALAQALQPSSRADARITSEVAARTLQGGAADAYRRASAPQADEQFDSRDDPADADDAYWAWRVLSAQGENRVAHRLGTLLLVADGRLTELDVALFEQGGDDGGAPGGGAFAHRRIALSFEAGSFGVVEAVATFAGGRVAVSLCTENADATQFLSAKAEDLQADLEAFGLGVDELAYETRAAAAPNAAVRSVVEHLVSAGSVSRLA